MSYPWYTPYQFAGNMPIVAIDLDGAEPDIKTKPKEALILTAVQTKTAQKIEGKVEAKAKQKVITETTKRGVSGSGAAFLRWGGCLGSYTFHSW